MGGAVSRPSTGNSKDSLVTFVGPSTLPITPSWGTVQMQFSEPIMPVSSSNKTPHAFGNGPVVPSSSSTGGIWDGVSTYNQKVTQISTRFAAPLTLQQDTAPLKDPMAGGGQDSTPKQKKKDHFGHDWGGTFDMRTIQLGAHPPPPATRQASDVFPRGDSMMIDDNKKEEMVLELVDSRQRVWKRSDTVIGRGGFGKVYQGMDTEGKTVAMKFIAGEDNDTEQIFQEIQFLEQLEHPNIVKYLGFVKRDTGIYIVMEFIPCGSISTLIKKFGRLHPRTAANYTRDILQGLNYLHKKGIIHRDIKPQNVLVDAEGRCKLTDFGTAKRLETETVAQQGAPLAGTPLYLPPEAIKGSPLTLLSDIWSLGISILEMVAGVNPYKDFIDKTACPSFYSIIYHISNNPPVIPSFVTGPCREFIDECLTVDESKRPSAEDLMKHQWLL